MIVAVACDADAVSPHFGRCERFLIAEVKGQSVTVTKWLPNPGHEPGLLPRLMADAGVHCVIAGGAGPRAVGLLADAGIHFIAGVIGGPAQALADLANGRLTEGESTCDH